jgi:hypothetical protein
MLLPEQSKVERLGVLKGLKKERRAVKDKVPVCAAWI